jgi:hypothetical protein
MSEPEIATDVSTRKIRWTEIAWVTALVALPFVYFAVVLLPEPFGLGKHYANDFYGNRIWWTQFNAYFLSHNLLPLWNPLERFGVMQLGYRGANLVYPPGWWVNAAFLKGGAWNYYAEYFQIALHMSWGLSGVYLLLRKFARVHPSAAVLGASLVLLNQRFNEFIQYANTIETYAWMPWVLLCTLALTTRAKADLADAPRQALAWALGLGLCVGLSILAGYPHLAYSGILFTAVVGLLTLRSARGLIYLGVGGLVAALIALPTMIGLVADLLGAPERTGGNIAWADAYPIGYSYFTMFAKPYLIDVQASCYFMPVFLLLAGVGGVVSMIPAGQRRLAIALVVGIVLMADISQGSRGFTFTFLYHYLPGFSGFRIQGRHNWITLVGLAYFVARGADWLQQRPKWAELMWIPLLLMSLRLIYGFQQIGADGSSFAPYVMGTIAPEASLAPFIWLTLGGGVVVLTFLRFQLMPMRMVSLVVLVGIFVAAHAQYTTWLKPDMSVNGQRGPAESFPDGLLERMTPFQGDPSRMLHPKGERDSDDPMNIAYAAAVPEGTRFPANRFAVNTPATVTLDRFGPNELQVTVKQDVAQPVMYFGTYFPFWKSNVPMRRGEGAFERFMVFDVGAGETRIELVFRHGLIVCSMVLSLVMVPLAVAGMLALNRRRVLAVLVVLWMFVPVSLFLYGVNKEGALPESVLYGPENQALDPEGSALILQDTF